MNLKGFTENEPQTYFNFFVINTTLPLDNLFLFWKDPLEVVESSQEN